MTIRDNLRNCEIITQKRMLGISNKFYFAHDVAEAVLKFRKYQEIRRDAGLIGADDVNKFNEIFGEF